MDSQHATRNLLSYGGGAVALLGVAMLLADASPGGFQPPPALSLGVAVGGLACWIASDFVEHPVATQADLDAWADRYNEQLRAHIQRTRAIPEPAGSVALAPLAGLRGQLGLSFTGRF